MRSFFSSNPPSDIYYFEPFIIFVYPCDDQGNRPASFMWNEFTLLAYQSIFYCSCWAAHASSKFLFVFIKNKKDTISMTFLFVKLKKMLFS